MFNEFRLASEERIATAQANAALANERAAQLEKEARNAQLEQERLKSLVAWRQIQPAAADLLTHSLVREIGVATVAYVSNDPEALSYALQFKKVLEQAGWKTRLESRTYSNMPVVGISIPFHIGNTSTPLLHKAFGAAGIAYRTEPLPTPDMSFSPPDIPGSALIFIGSKPPPF